MHVKTLARRLGSVALVAGLALGAAGCSEDPSSGTDANGAEDTSADESSDPEVEEGSDPDAEESADEEAAFTELSAADFYPTVMGALKEAETFAFESTTRGSAQASTISGEARYADSGMEMKASSSGAQAMDLIMLDQMIYMKAPAMGLGDKWMKIDLSKSGDSLFGMLAKAADPDAMFKAMEAPKNLELLGTEEVEGVETNHYRITVDPDAYMKAMGFPAEMSSFMPEELVTEMWVDAENLPRKFTQVVQVPAVGGAKPSTSATEGYYHDFGLDVDIEAPPASETTDAPTLPGA